MVLLPSLTPNPTHPRPLPRTPWHARRPAHMSARPRPPWTRTHAQDSEVRRTFQRTLEKQGMKFKLNTKARREGRL
jgi:hypothetical protein